MIEGKLKKITEIIEEQEEASQKTYINKIPLPKSGSHMYKATNKMTRSPKSGLYK